MACKGGDRIGHRVSARHRVRVRIDFTHRSFLHVLLEASALLVVLDSPVSHLPNAPPPSRVCLTAVPLALL